MSVAFRRDGDEEHLEPRFERPIPPGPNWVTRAGLAALERSAGETEEALAAGPDEVMRGALERDLRYWRQRLATAQLAPQPPAGEAGIGSAVRFRLDGEERTVVIVGADEADGRDRIGFAAPLARALIGAGAGDTADYAGRADAIEVLAVSTPL